MLILLPGAERPDGVTDLLIRALPRIGARGVAGNPAAEQAGFCRELELHRPDCLVAAPGQLRRLLGAHPASPGIRSILSSAEPLPQDLEEALVHGWHCEVFDHYGLTETGYGGGVECCGKQGYHLREGVCFSKSSIRFPVSADGTPGEVVHHIDASGHAADPLPDGDMAAMLPARALREPAETALADKGRFRKVGGRLKCSLHAGLDGRFRLRGFLPAGFGLCWPSVRHRVLPLKQGRTHDRLYRRAVGGSVRQRLRRRHGRRRRL
ncbi:MAG: AMP-binding protein [Bilophila wadsworthia]